uniref:Geranylgeranyl pyrophosphate synthase n=1 Tax=Corethron hystrix TaxID=216773 RepID=A0A6U5JU78_9STRA|mmetsp:Transcript_38444/g.89373  ORF Transcript_38444/g.89373 Transcript_38444/m.89373 type:complete len:340 (+) Transcript_38444:81-1100(+)
MVRYVSSVLALTLVASAGAFSPAFVGPVNSRSSSVSMSASATTFDLDSYLKEKIGVIEQALDASIVSTVPQTEKICESMRYSLMAGGKRIRPALCLAACNMFGGSDDDAMPTAVALEMIHTMSLIHDDLPSMDDDDLRRGKPTNHVLYGEDVAILAGDAMLSTSFEHVARHTPKSVPAERTLDVLVRLGKCVGPVGLAGGQVMDLECEAKEGVTLEDLTWIHTHKTAALLQVAVSAGAILGGASPEEVERCEKFALDIGLAFQVADDILDVTADSQTLGKTAGKDEATDKTTYVKLMGLEGSKKEARRLIDEAKECLEPFGERAAPLLAIADFIVDRKN